jgi:hypothetical protein
MRLNLHGGHGKPAPNYRRLKMIITHEPVLFKTMPLHQKAPRYSCAQTVVIDGEEKRLISDGATRYAAMVDMLDLLNMHGIRATEGLVQDICDSVEVA